MTQQAERRRDRTSFQELAKLAQTPPPPSVGPDSLGPKSGPLSGGPVSGPLSQPAASNPLVWPSTPNVNAGPWSGADSDSGMVDLKGIAQSDPAAADRAKSTPLASEGLFEDGPVSAAPMSAPAASASAPMSVPMSSPAAASIAPSPSAAPAVSGVTAVPSAAPAVPAWDAMPAKKEKKESKAGVVIALVAVLGAMAAGGAIFMSKRNAQPIATAPKAPVVTQEAPKPAEPVAQAPAAPVEQAAAPVEPVQEVAANDVKQPTKGGKHKPGFKINSTGEAPKETVAEAKVDKKAAGNVNGFTGTLQQEMEKRVGPAEKTEKEPQVANDVRGTQPKPSQGQVQGAIGAVLMKARECLGPDDPVSKANVVFGSSGAVQSVSVSGGAAGKPAEACIKTALGKAKVPAFADETYSFPVTVRPL